MIVELVEDSLIDGVNSSRELLVTKILHLLGTGTVLSCFSLKAALGINRSWEGILVVGIGKRELVVPTGMHEAALYNLIFDTNVHDG